MRRLTFADRAMQARHDEARAALDLYAAMSELSGSAATTSPQEIAWWDAIAATTPVGRWAQQQRARTAQITSAGTVSNAR